MILPLTLGLCLSALAAPPSITTDRPVNLFPAGRDVVIFVAAEAPAALPWSCTDFHGATVASGQVITGSEKTPVTITGLPCGYYSFTCGEGDNAARASFGVVVDYSAAAPPEGRINVDGALSWLTDKENFAPLAQALRTVGIGWVRERFGWGDVSPEPGKINWKQYDVMADVMRETGIRVYQIWHDSPGWTRPGDDTTRTPQDLREVYRFTKTLAEHYRGRVQAWEVWNEPDIGFWPDLSDTYTGLLKAAYLGFKAGDADLPVLMGSFCRGYSAFDEGVMDSGAADYFDIFNWHSYNPPEAYAGILSRYLELMDKHGCADRPVWMSECGIPMRASLPEGEFTPEDDATQARFIPRSFASSLAAGTDRHFFFVYPFYLEGINQFGVLHKDLSPRPAFIAIAAAAHYLGQSVYLGRYDLDAEGAAGALAFDTPHGRLLVAWADTPQTVQIAGVQPGARVANLFGDTRRVEVTDGTVSLELGPEPCYLIGLDDAIVAGLTGEPRPQGQLPTNTPCPLVVRGQAQLAVDKNRDAYNVGMAPFAYRVEACLLAETGQATGTISLLIPEGWSCEPASVPVSLDAMGRAVAEFNVTPAATLGKPARITVVPSFAGFDVQPSVSTFRISFNDAPVVASKSLDLGDPTLWTPNISGNGHMELSAPEPGVVRSSIHFTGPGDRWCYPQAKFDPPRDFSEWQGLEYEYRCPEGSLDAAVRTQVVEVGGASYLDGGQNVKREWTRVRLAFDELGWGPFSAADLNGRFDTQAIGTLMIGLNTPMDELTLDVRNIRLVRFTP